MTVVNWNRVKLVIRRMGCIHDLSGYPGEVFATLG